MAIKPELFHYNDSEGLFATASLVRLSQVSPQGLVPDSPPLLITFTDAGNGAVGKGDQVRLRGTLSVRGWDGVHGAPNGTVHPAAGSPGYELFIAIDVLGVLESFSPGGIMTVAFKGLNPKASKKSNGIFKDDGGAGGISVTSTRFVTFVGASGRLKLRRKPDTGRLVGVSSPPSEILLHAVDSRLHDGTFGAPGPKLLLVDGENPLTAHFLQEHLDGSRDWLAITVTGANSESFKLALEYPAAPKSGPRKQDLDLAITSATGCLAHVKPLQLPKPIPTGGRKKLPGGVIKPFS